MATSTTSVTSWMHLACAAAVHTSQIMSQVSSAYPKVTVQLNPVTESCCRQSQCTAATRYATTKHTSFTQPTSSFTQPMSSFTQPTTSFTQPTSSFTQLTTSFAQCLRNPPQNNVSQEPNRIISFKLCIQLKTFLKGKQIQIHKYVPMHACVHTRTHSHTHTPALTHAHTHMHMWMQNHRKESRIAKKCGILHNILWLNTVQLSFTFCTSRHTHLERRRQSHTHACSTDCGSSFPLPPKQTHPDGLFFCGSMNAVQTLKSAAPIVNKALSQKQLSVMLCEAGSQGNSRCSPL